MALDQTIAYAASGGQPGDSGYFISSQGTKHNFSDTHFNEDSSIIYHILDTPSSLQVGDNITVELDWQKRYTLMKMHSALHVLCGLVNEPVMGGGMNTDSSRIDFNLPNPIDKMALQQQFNNIITQDYIITTEILSKENAQQGLDKVRTAGVTPNVSDNGLRMVKIANDSSVLDEQPCGGTHVHSTKELNGIIIKKIEKKNKDSRRIRIALEEPAA